MYIVGLTTLGDSAASLIKDGEIVAAAEEERFSRRKHHSGFPYNAMQYCLDQAGNARMMKGYLNTSNTSTTTVTISGLPATFRPIVRGWSSSL